MLGVLAAVLAGVLVLFGFGQALGARAHAQRAADLAAVSAAQVMRRNFARLFEPVLLEGGAPNPRHLSNPAFVALARGAALRGAVRNGVERARVEVTFPATRFAPTRVTVAVRDRADLRLPGDRRAPGRGAREGDGRDRRRRRCARDAQPGQRRRVLRAARLPAGQADAAGRRGRVRSDGRGRSRRGRPDLLVTSGYRSDAEQARLFAAHPDPKWVAPPGKSLHRYGTELDLGPPAAYAWLAANADGSASSNATNGSRGTSATRSTPAPPRFAASGRAPRRHVCRRSSRPQYRDRSLARAAQRWNVGAALLAAQLYVESGFDPLARSPSGAQGIAQFMPGTAAALGLADPFDAPAAIDAQAHLMRDLLRRFGLRSAGSGRLQRGRGRRGGLHVHPAVSGDAGVRGEDPRAARRRRRSRRQLRGAPGGMSDLAPGTRFTWPAERPEPRQTGQPLDRERLPSVWVGLPTP